MNWQDALSEAISTYVPDAGWGASDCCQFVNAYWRSLTGNDIAQGFDYASRGDALRIVAEHGGLEGLLTDVLGAPEDEPEPGDIVLAWLNDEHTLSVPAVHGGYCLHFVHPDLGLARCSTKSMERGAAWRSV